MRKFKQKWEEFEKAKIAKDIKMRVDVNNVDKEWIGENGDRLKDEEEKIVDEKLAERDDVQDEEHSKLIRNQILLQYQAEQIEEKAAKRVAAAAAALQAAEQELSTVRAKVCSGFCYWLGRIL